MKLVKCTTLAGLLIAFTSTPCFCQSYDDYNDTRRIRTLFTNHKIEFLSFADTLAGTSEGKLAEKFYVISLKADHESDIIMEEILIIDFISHADSKKRVQDVVAMRINRTLKQIDISLEQINKLLPLTDKPAIVKQANRLKDDMQKFMKTLQAISEKLPKTESKEPEE